MSEILIKGMEMPKSCGECRASGTDVCRKWMGKKNLKVRSEDCPLVELPEHGDLIDRRKLWKDTEGLGEYCCDRDFISLCDAISEAPTVLGASK